MNSLKTLVEHGGNSVLVRNPEEYVCCVGCRGTRVKAVVLYCRLNEEIRNARPGVSATLGAVGHNLIASWRNEPCPSCKGVGYWKP